MLGIQSLGLGKNKLGDLGFRYGVRCMLGSQCLGRGKNRIEI